MKFPIASALLLSLSLLSCSKKGSSGPTKTELLTSSTWKFDRVGLDLDKNGSIDADLPPGYVLACDTDNSITFKSDFTGTGDEGATKCDPADPQTEAFTWSFQSNETVINFPSVLIAGISGDVRIKQLTATDLDLLKDVVVSGTTVTVVIELKH